MEAIASAQSFIERCQRGEDVNALVAAFESTLKHLGFRLFACASHPPGAVLVHNYPEPWVRFYTDSQLYLIDPVLQHAGRVPLPFFWDAKDVRTGLTSRQREVFVAARNYGITGGYTIPIHVPPSLGIPSGSCSVVPQSGQLDPECYVAVSLMAPYLYYALSQTTAATKHPSILSRRERQCLALVAQGKDDWTIGRLLRISEHTAHAYIESAKRRLGVATRPQAIAQALAIGELSPGECHVQSYDELLPRAVGKATVNPPDQVDVAKDPTPISK